MFARPNLRRLAQRSRPSGLHTAAEIKGADARWKVRWRLHKLADPSSGMEIAETRRAAAAVAAQAETTEHRAARALSRNRPELGGWEPRATTGSTNQQSTPAPGQ